ncbi:hypothetical protein SLEP1_g47893 [Rubroshorea leprosula]|uniref:Uncharacterized protein n=1 Tax=Rubroshorea leprosula TaxID=152421 RepID=A0AAV5LU96_9ROSI|nr:hypothetical protein SLEP1_g47893 [Rubroshorea leprosula]
MELFRFVLKFGIDYEIQVFVNPAWFCLGYSYDY